MARKAQKCPLRREEPYMFFSYTSSEALQREIQKEEKFVQQEVNQLAIPVFSLSNTSYSYPFWQSLSMS